MKRGRRFFANERGIIPLLLALLIGAAAFVSVGIALLGGSDKELRQQSASAGRLEQLEKRLRVYAFEKGRLPCPAYPDSDGSARASCTGGNNAGIVPWKTIGLSRADSQDDFGRMISYIIDPALASGNFCAGLPAALAGSLAVQPSGGPRLFSLISHGPSGFGAWLPNGRQMQNPVSAIERANCVSTTAGSPVTCNDPNTASVTTGPYNSDIGSTNFFDDNVLLSVSANYTPVCAKGVFGAQVSFENINGTAAAGVEGLLVAGAAETFHGTADSNSNATAAPRVTIGAAGAPTLVKLGASDTNGRSCIFIKNFLNLRLDGANKVLRSYLEFALRTDGSAGGARGEGIVLAFVPGDDDSGPNSYDDSDPLCGGSAQRLGYHFAAGNNFPDSGKFGVEFDTRLTSNFGSTTVSDPDNNHVAIDRNEVTHSNTGGPRCLASAPGALAAPPAGCMQDPVPPTDRDWLEQGQTLFHRMRVDVHANGIAVLPADCGNGEVSVQVWLFQNGAQCTDGCNNLTSNYANTGTAATAMIKHCLPVTHNKVLVGITTGYGASGSEPVLRNFGITEANQ